MDKIEIAGVVALRVPKGEFIMGAQATDPHGDNYDPQAYSDEGPPHRVVIEEDYYMGQYPITVGQWNEYATATGKPTEAGNASHPVVNVSYYDAQGYVEWLNTQPGVPEGFEVCLPSEEEWEYMARGSDGRRYPWGNEPPTNELAVFERGEIAEVGTCPKGAGPFGHEDVAGNVWEWCSDRWEPSYENKIERRKKGNG